MSLEREIKMTQGKNKYLELFLTFFRIGLFTIGGGYAILPMLKKEFVDEKKIMTEDELLDFYAISQSTPGIISTNVSTFIGYKEAGFPGVIFSSLGMVTPSLIIIIIIAAFFDNFAEIVYVQKAFMGIRIVILALILNAVLKMGKKSIKNLMGYIILIASFLAVTWAGITPILVLFLSGFIGFIMGAYREKAGEK